MVRLKVRITGALPAFTALQKQLDREVKKAFADGAEDVANDAKARHAFTNRTEKLEGSIHDNAPIGTLSSDTLSVTVSATMPYASYVEEKVTYKPWAYLQPAWQRMKDSFSRKVDAAILSAIHRAGF